MLRQVDRQVDVDEEILEDLERHVDAAEQTAAGVGRSAEPPGGDGIGEVDAEMSDALVVGDEGGLPEHGFGEVLADLGDGGGAGAGLPWSP